MFANHNRDYSAAELRMLLQKINEEIRENLIPDDHNHSEYYYQNFTSISLRTLKYVNQFLNTINCDQVIGTVIDTIIASLSLTFEQHKSRIIYPKDGDESPISKQLDEVDRRQDQLYHFINTRASSIPLQCLPNAEIERQRLQLADFVKQIDEKKKTHLKNTKRSFRFSNNNSSTSKIIKKITISSHLEPIQEESHFQGNSMIKNYITHNEGTQTQANSQPQGMLHFSVGSKNDLLDYSKPFNFDSSQMKNEQKNRTNQQQSKTKSKSKRKKRDMNININNSMKSGVNREKIPQNKKFKADLIGSYRNTQMTKQQMNEKQEGGLGIEHQNENIQSRQLMRGANNLHLCEEEISISIFKVNGIYTMAESKHSHLIHQQHAVDQIQAISEENSQNYDTLSRSNQRIKMTDDYERKNSCVIRSQLLPPDIAKYMHCSSSQVVGNGESQVLKAKVSSQKMSTSSLKIAEKPLKNKVGARSSQIHSRYSQQASFLTKKYSHSPSMMLLQSRYSNTPSFGVFVRNSKINLQENSSAQQDKIKEVETKQENNFADQNTIENENSCNKVQQNRKILLSELRKGMTQGMKQQKYKQRINKNHDNKVNCISLHHSQEKESDSQSQNELKLQNAMFQGRQKDNNKVNRIDTNITEIENTNNYPFTRHTSQQKCSSFLNYKLFNRKSATAIMKRQKIQQINSKSKENNGPKTNDASAINTNFQSVLSQQKSKNSLKQVAKALKQKSRLQKRSAESCHIELNKTDLQQLGWNMRTKGRKQKVRQYLQLIEEIHRKFCGSKCPHLQSLIKQVKEGAPEGVLMTQLLRLLRR